MTAPSSVEPVVGPPPTPRDRLRAAALAALSWVTNHVVARVPSFTVRRAWYRALGVDVGDGVGIHLGCFLWFFGPGQLRRTGTTIGARTRVNRRCTIDARGPLTIGSDVSISPEVSILTAQHDWRAPGFRMQLRPVVIEDHVWIGTRAVVLPGAHIGRGAVVAAGAVVSGVVEPMAVVAGVPARRVATRPAAGIDYCLDDPLPWFD
jgi:maltose O-acetyltransferase